MAVDLVLIAGGICAGVLVVRYHQRPSDRTKVRPGNEAALVITPLRPLARDTFAGAAGPNLANERLKSAAVTANASALGVISAPAARPESADSDNYNKRLQAAGFLIDRRYRGFLAGYAEEGKDASRLRTMLIERQMIGSEILDVAQAQGLDLSDPKVRSSVLGMISSSAREYASQIRDTIGDADYRSLQKYESMQPERTVAEELPRRMAGTGGELSDNQQNQLVDILYRSKEPNGGRLITNSFGPNKPPLPDHAAVRVIPPGAIESLRGVLSAQQLAVLSSIADEQHRDALPHH